MADTFEEEPLKSKWKKGFEGQIIVSTTADGWLIYPRLANGVMDNDYMRHTETPNVIGDKVLQVYSDMLLDPEEQ